MRAAAGLARFDSPKVVAALRVALHDKEGPVRLAAAEALVEVSPSEAGRAIAEAMVKFHQPELGRSLLRLTLDVSVAAPLRQALKRADQEWQRLTAAGTESATSSDNPVAPILEALGRISDPRAARELLGILEEFDAYRRSLVDILIGLGDGIRPQLQESYDRATGPFLQALLEIQARLGIPLPPDRAVAALQNDNEQVRRMATEVLIRNREKNALIDAFQQELAKIQSAKARNDFNFYDLELRVVERADALGRLGDPEALPALEAGRDYPSERIRGFLDMVIEALKAGPAADES